MNVISQPFNDLRNLLRNLPYPDRDVLEAVRNRQKELAKPQGSLGRMEEIALWLAGWQGQVKPVIKKPLVAVFAANHGVSDEDVSPFSRRVTRQMVDNFSAGGAAINQICLANGLGLKVYDLALDYSTGNICKEAAMDKRGCAATVAFGMEAIAGGTDLICLGEMGIGNTTIAAALSFGLFGGKVEEWVGPGTGAIGMQLERKTDIVHEAVALHKEFLDDPFEVLRRLGGRELAAIAGAILAARMEKIPVILDGFAVTAAAAVLFKESPDALDHCLAGHVSSEPGHRKLLEKIGKKPLLDLGMYLGEGTGAALAAGIVRAAALCNAQMATFKQAKIDRKQEHGLSFI